MTRFIYYLQAKLLAFLFLGFRLLPLDFASFLGGLIARAVGPMLPAHGVAKENIRHAFPEKTPVEQTKIIQNMWDNLGRNAAETSSLAGTRLTSRTIVSGTEYFPTREKPALFFSGHLGNWDLLYPAAFVSGVPISIVYRHINNPYVDEMIANLRQPHCTSMFAKGPKAGPKMLRALKNGESIAMLVDQKMNSGIAISFFGRDAMTATAIAELSLRFDLPIIPTRVVRKGGAHFETMIYPPMEFAKTGDKEADIRMIMTKINAILEGWIRENPEQWFWVHRRWPNKTS